MKIERFVELLNDCDLKKILSLKLRYEKILKEKEISYEQLQYAQQYDYMICENKKKKKNLVSYDGYIIEIKEISEIIKHNIDSINCVFDNKSNFEIHQKALTLAYNSMIDDQIESFEKDN